MIKILAYIIHVEIMLGDSKMNVLMIPVVLMSTVG